MESGSKQANITGRSSGNDFFVRGISWYNNILYRYRTKNCHYELVRSTTGPRVALLTRAGALSNRAAENVTIYDSSSSSKILQHRFSAYNESANGSVNFTSAVSLNRGTTEADLSLNQRRHCSRETRVGGKSVSQPRVIFELTDL